MFADDQDAPKADKNSFTFFNPTPQALMRELSTDRPDKTESAYTVDAGHYQLEVDLLSYSHDRDKEAGATVNAFAVAPINFKFGLLNNVDLQTVIETYNSVVTRDHSTGDKKRQTGFGDITSRLKINMWGNDGGTTALALMPFVKFPTSQDDLGNDSVEGGLIIPLAIELPAGFGMGLMTEFDLNRDESGSDHHFEFINSITIGRDLWRNLGGYVEFFSAVSSEDSSAWEGTFDVGLTFGVTENLQLDCGVNIGVTRSAEDLRPFVGIACRF